MQIQVTQDPNWLLWPLVWGSSFVGGGRGCVSQCQLWPHYVDEWGEGVRLALCWLLLLYVCSSCLHYQSWGRGRNRVKRHQPVQGKSLNSDKLPTVQFLRPSLVKPRNWTWEPHKMCWVLQGEELQSQPQPGKGEEGMDAVGKVLRLLKLRNGSVPGTDAVLNWFCFYTNLHQSSRRDLKASLKCFDSGLFTDQCHDGQWRALDVEPKLSEVWGVVG